MNYEKYIKLAEGEEILQKVEGDANTLASGPLAKVLSIFINIIDKIFGRSRKVMIIISNKRVIELSTEKVLWKFDKGVEVINYTPRAINYVGYALVKDWLVFNTNYFVLSTISANTKVIFKGKKEELFDMVEKASASLERLG